MLKLAYVGRQKWINGRYRVFAYQKHEYTQLMATFQPNTSELSLVYGPTDKPLWETTLGNFLNEQVQKFGDKTAVAFPWQNVQFTYKNLAERSLIVARGLLAHNLKPGDFVGIFAGNRYEYLEVFLGASQIGCPVVVLNNTYTPQELVRALSQSSCKLLFISTSLKDKSFNEHIHLVLGNTKDTRVLSELQIVTFGPPRADLRTARLQSYETFTGTHPTPLERQRIKRAGSHVCPTDVVNLQFTSGPSRPPPVPLHTNIPANQRPPTPGTTGAPKAAMLTHRYAPAPLSSPSPVPQFAPETNTPTRHHQQQHPQ
ncbi:AMP-dependent synthetase/ligase [Macrophomina phaseolina MS6]|uniref:AMP-dependent synthetase/ligase n=1 Tax=Macrophomina phaseolina (strain MS6) TaxID=1126212 RepID=K2SIH3_MACPH|nr:AMP-dependent synthetase/ligase [Macrophomina phaseolina MS6]